MVAPGKLELLVQECRNLPVHSDKTVVCIVKVEIAGRLLGESARVEVKEGESCALFDFTASLEVPGGSQENVDEMMSNPLLLTAVEVHPKDKKSKEEKTSVLGQVAIDLAPVVMEGAQFEGSLQLMQPSSDQAPPTQGAVGVVADVALKVVNPFLPVQDASNSNLLFVRVDSLYSVPEAWLPVGTPGHKFELALGVPCAEDQTSTLVLANGCLRNPPTKDPEAAATHWKWAHLTPECSKVALIPNSPIEPCALEDEDGELTGKEEHAFRIKTQKELPRVTWNMEQRSWLSQDACQRMRKDLAQCSCVPMELIRMTAPPSTGKGKAKDEEPVPSYHGVAYVNLSSLLYPGVSKVRGAFPVLPYCESEFNDKTKVSSGSHYAGMVARAQTAEAALAKAKQGGGKRAASTLKTSPADMLQESEANLAAVDSKELAEGLEFKDSRTYVLLEISLQKPLIPRRTDTVLAESVAEYIPPRPAVPKRLGGAERAVKGFQDHCAEVVKCLLGEYRDMFGVPSSSANGPAQLEERRRKFLFSLNSSGKYYAFKEDLKRAVVKVVREKFVSKSSSFNDPQQLQLFISELYAYLLDQMHLGMSQVLSLENPPQAPPSFTSTDLLGLFAGEAEVYGDLTLADHYHRQRLVEEDHIAAHWYNYGVYCLRCGNVEKGEQCFKQALSLDSSHVPSLILYSICCALDERFDEGETFLEMATAKDPENAVAWTVTGLFYELCGKVVCQNHSFRQAELCGGSTRQKTFIVQPSIKESDTYLSPKPNLKNSSSVSQAAGPSLRGTADTTSQVSASTSVKPEATVSVVLEEEPTEDNAKSKAPTLPNAAVDSPSSVKKPMGLATGEEEREDEKPALKLSVSRMESVSMRSDDTPTRKANSDLITAPAEAPTVSVYLATANFLLDVGALKFAEMSLAHELDLSDNQPSPAYHVAQSRYFMTRKDFEQAISSVDVAIKEETENPSAWATLGHVHYLSGDLMEAQSAFERALAFVGDCPEIHSVHLRLGDIYLQSNQFKKAKDIFLLASQHCPSSVTWRGVGIACYRLGELENAMDALCEANILNNHDSIVWAYLTLVSVKTKRLSEAEQAYKFMMRGGMEDSHLLDEVKSVSSAFIHT